jgi:hypothetical protein
MASVMAALNEAVADSDRRRQEVLQALMQRQAEAEAREREKAKALAAQRASNPIWKRDDERRRTKDAALQRIKVGRGDRGERWDAYSPPYCGLLSKASVPAGRSGELRAGRLHVPA